MFGASLSYVASPVRPGQIPNVSLIIYLFLRSFWLCGSVCVIYSGHIAFYTEYFSGATEVWRFAILRWSHGEAMMKPWWSQDEAKMKPRWSQDEAIVMKPRWSHHEAIMKPWWSQDEAKMKPRWSQDEAMMKPRWSHDDEAKMKPWWSKDEAKMKP